MYSLVTLGALMLEVRKKDAHLRFLDQIVLISPVIHVYVCFIYK